MTHAQVDVPGNADVWEEEDWDELLAYIEDQRVIPIVGPDLLQVQCEGKTVLLDRYLASQLASKYGLPPEALPAEPTLNAVVCQLLRRKRREALYPAIKDLVSKAKFTLPKPLLQLAEITHFNLFVTTNFDELLEEAINTVRFGGKAETVSIAYSPDNVKDLPRGDSQRPTVYHLLGKLSTAPVYAISDEDLLEFVHALQSESHRPERLFDELESNHLLILGGNFSDWLARFFLRAAKRHRLSETRSVLEIMADSRTHDDASLVLFLRHFSSRTRIFRGGGAIEFLEALWQRWRKRNPNPQPELPPPPPGAVFISYAREDVAAVQELKKGLDSQGLTVWFDFDRLGAGDAYDRKIKKNIADCSCFLVVLSQNTEERREGYFRREWNYALDRDKSIDPGKPFIIPVIVDDTQKVSRVPDRFLELHHTWLAGGQVTPEFVKRIQEIVAGHGQDGPSARSQTT